MNSVKSLVVIQPGNAFHCLAEKYEKELRSKLVLLGLQRDKMFKYLRDVDNDHKIGEKLRKLVTDNLLKLGEEENQQSLLRSVKKHASLLDI